MGIRKEYAMNGWTFLFAFILFVFIVMYILGCDDNDDDDNWFDDIFKSKRQFNR